MSDFLEIFDCSGEDEHAHIEGGESRMDEGVRIWNLGEWRSARIVDPRFYDPSENGSMVEISETLNHADPRAGIFPAMARYAVRLFAGATSDAGAAW